MTARTWENLCRNQKGVQAQRILKRLRKIKEKFENNDYSLDQYISAVSNWVGFRS